MNAPIEKGTPSATLVMFLQDFFNQFLLDQDDLSYLESIFKPLYRSLKD